MDLNIDNNYPYFVLVNQSNQSKSNSGIYFLSCTNSLISIYDNISIYFTKVNEKQYIKTLTWGTCAFGDMISSSTNTARSTVQSCTCRNTGFLSLRQTADFIFLTLTIGGTFLLQRLSTTLPIVRVTCKSTKKIHYKFCEWKKWR